MESSPRIMFCMYLEQNKQKEQEKAVKKTKAKRIYRDIEIFVATKQNVRGLKKVLQHWKYVVTKAKKNS